MHGLFEITDSSDSGTDVDVGSNDDNDSSDNDSSGNNTDDDDELDGVELDNEGHAKDFLFICLKVSSNMIFLLP